MWNTTSGIFSNSIDHRTTPLLTELVVGFGFEFYKYASPTGLKQTPKRHGFVFKNKYTNTNGFGASARTYWTDQRLEAR